MDLMVRSRAPLRLGLAGGGTDISPYCDKYGGVVLNATIERYAYCFIWKNQDKKVIFKSADLNIEEIHASQEKFCISGNLILHRAVYNKFVEHYNDGIPLNISVITSCDAPIGSGLGSSSTIVVSMIKAYSELLNIPLDDYEVAFMAHQIERVDCNLAGGKQDQYSASFGGFNFMEFGKKDSALVNPLRIKNWIINEFEASSLLFYGGKSRNSSKIIEDQKQNLIHNDEQAILAMHNIKSEALLMKEALLKGEFRKIVDSMREGWEAKKRSSSSVSNEAIEEIFKTAYSAGAQCGKVSGAGGGGYILFISKPENRAKVLNALKKYNGELNPCHFTNLGAQSWRAS